MSSGQNTVVAGLSQSREQPGEQVEAANALLINSEPVVPRMEDLLASLDAEDWNDMNDDRGDVHVHDIGLDGQTDAGTVPIEVAPEFAPEFAPKPVRSHVRNDTTDLVHGFPASRVSAVPGLEELLADLDAEDT